MRLLMLGTGPFAAPTFAALLDAPHTVLGLVTRPTRAAHSRDKTPLNPMRDLAEARGLPVWAPDDINAPAFLPELAALAPDLLVVCDYGQILKPHVLAAARFGGINLHGSLLPKYRGAAPVHWAIYRGETETGISVIHMTPGLDAGPILARRSTAIEPTETTAQLEPRLSQLGVPAVLEAIALIAQTPAGAVLGTPQDKSLATSAPRLKKTDGAVDWRRSAAAIANQVRAFQPWPGSYSNWLRAAGAPLRLILDRVSVVSGGENNAASPPGTIVASPSGTLHVATGDGVLSLEQLQPAGKRPLSAAEFLRGHRLIPGERLGDAGEVTS